MSQLVESIISDLRASGLEIKDANDGWFALFGEANASFPKAFLHLTDDDVEAYLSGMTDDDVDGAFGPDVEPDRARWSLTLVHLEESLRAGSAAPRYVVVDRGRIHVFTPSAVPGLPPGDYEWRATPDNHTRL